MHSGLRDRPSVAILTATHLLGKHRPKNPLHRAGARLKPTDDLLADFFASRLGTTARIIPPLPVCTLGSEKDVARLAARLSFHSGLPFTCEAHLEVIVRRSRPTACSWFLCGTIRAYGAFSLQPCLLRSGV